MQRELEALRKGWVKKLVITNLKKKQHLFFLLIQLTHSTVDEDVVRGHSLPVSSLGINLLIGNLVISTGLSNLTQESPF